MKGLQDAGFTKEEARIISDYAKAGEASPLVQTTAAAVKTVFRMVTLIAIAIVVLYFL